MADSQVRSLSGTPVSLNDEQLAEIQGAIHGQVICPGDTAYDQSREIWNAMIDRKPGLILVCSGTADVMSAVAYARKHNLLVSVRGAGHNIAGKSLSDGAVLIDLSALKSVRVDPDAKTVKVGPGATLGDLDHETQAFGLACPVGINSTTGVAGLTLGGGFGWLSRSYGMTVDNLISAEIVTAGGARLVCNEQQNPDLFWAIRGGGGNFGIVTEFEFRLHPVGPMLMAGPTVFPFSQAKSVLGAYRELCAKAPDQLTVWAVIRDAPPLPFLEEEVHGTKVVIIVGVYNGELSEGEKALAPIHKLGDELGTGIGAYPFAGFQQAFDPLLTPGARNYWKSHNFTGLPDDLIDMLVDYGGRLPSSQSEIFVAQMGGATNRVDPVATAYPHRDTEFIMNVHTRWETEDQDKNCIDWARDFYDATRPLATGGVYVNFISEGEDRIDGAYGANYDRLAAIKAQMDPDNFFRENQNITPN
ncbi:FAD-binding oxidoreductase [Marinobacterium lutimaris]|uniref:FAD/FMN-containing dehydrogenase n=1 Tax=Marinobacterium lutimaris TaxID=568106 RepID=A0A1H5YMS2_9GAMM|nr:FAD-binding oxidoreductase [Marinobacterium lutimaris]SEG25050.1 FAD/FMN-containing dehydrogenase [Marinobacterium lutimaris]